MALTKASAGVINTDQLVNNRNMIINGAMEVAQRANTYTSTNDSDYRTVDRWVGDTRTNGASSGNYRIEQSTDAPDTFKNSFKITNLTNTTLGSGGSLEIEHFIEGTNIVGTGWGTSSAKNVTLSFWCKTTHAGTYSVYFPSGNFALTYVATYTINSANTWEYKTITIPGPTTGTWYKTSTNRGIQVRFVLAAHSGGYTSNPNTWSSEANIKASSSQTQNMATTTDASFQLTGVQLETGSVATPFERRPYGLELQLCQRYFFATDTDEVFSQVLWGMYTTGNVVKGVLEYPVEMRSKPSISSGTGYGNYFYFQQGDSTLSTNGVFQSAWSAGSGRKKAWCDFGGVTGGTQGYTVAIYRNGSSANSVLWASAEL